MKPQDLSVCVHKLYKYFREPNEFAHMAGICVQSYNG